jgi:hypothetical protein
MKRQISNLVCYASWRFGQVEKSKNRKIEKSKNRKKRESWGAGRGGEGFEGELGGRCVWQLVCTCVSALVCARVHIVAAGQGGWWGGVLEVARKAPKRR